MIDVILPDAYAFSSVAAEQSGFVVASRTKCDINVSRRNSLGACSRGTRVAQLVDAARVGSSFVYFALRRRQYFSMIDVFFLRAGIQKSSTMAA